MTSSRLTLISMLLAFTQWAFHLHAEPVLHKTLRIEHGQPLVLVSSKSVLLIEFETASAEEAVVEDRENQIRSCLAEYRYRILDESGGLSEGRGSVQEAYRTISEDSNGRHLKDVGSKLGISAGEFYLWWSEAKAGEASWVYFRTESPVRFIQQLRGVRFEALDREQFEQFRNSRNVQDFVSAGRRVEVLGPSVFSNEPAAGKRSAGRIESGGIRDGVFSLGLNDLEPGRHYVIESSYELRNGRWNVVHAFTAEEASYQWNDPLISGTDLTFYRIRQGTH